MSTLIEYTEQLIQKLETVLSHFQGKGLDASFERWQTQLQDMRHYAQANQSVSIAVVGGTGAGKSTLINALLGVDLLPTHSFRTCTSAAIAIAYANRKTFQAQIDFLPLSAWESEKDLFLEEIQQSAESGHSSFVHQDFLYKAWSLYRPRQGQPPMPFPLEQLVELLKEPLPQSLRDHLASGQLILKDKSPEALKQQLTKFLTAESPIWPLIRQVRLTGPIEPLKDGLELIDLPGLNDPNPVRETITRKYLQHAEFICMVFGTGRGLTREVVDLLKEQSFFNQIVLDGKVSALAFIGTRADDFVPELERRNLNLAADSTIDQIRLARQNMIQQQIQQQLSELTLWFANRYKLSPQSQEIIQFIAQTLQQSPIYLTSALSYMVHMAWLPSEASLFTEVEQSGIPQLQAYLQEIVSNNGVKARKKLIRSQFQQMNQEVRRLVESLRQRQDLQQTPQAEQLLIQLHQLHQAQTLQLQKQVQELKQNLMLKQIQFEKQLAYTFGDLSHRLEILQARWQEHNWQHLQGAVKAKGRYHSARTGTQIDLLKDVQYFLETEIALDWYDFFQHRLLKEVDQSQGLMSALLEQSQSGLTQLLDQHPELVSRAQSLSQQGLEILNEQSYRTRRDLEAKIRDTQRQLGNLLENALKDSLEPVFESAASLSGTGVKQQILQSLEQGLQQSLSILNTQFQPALNQVLLSLSNQIESYQQELAKVVSTQLDLMCQV